MSEMLTDDIVRSSVYLWLRRNDPEMFDAWLNEVKAEAWDEGFDKAEQCHSIRACQRQCGGLPAWNPYREVSK